MRMNACTAGIRAIGGKNRGLAGSSVLCCLLTAACATTGPTPDTAKIKVKPSEIGRQFALLDESTAMNDEKRTIAFSTTDVREYDDFLRDATKTVLPVSMVDTTLDEIEFAAQDLAGLPHGPVENHEVLGAQVSKNRGSFTEKKLGRIRALVDVLDALMEKLKSTPEGATALAARGQELAKKVVESASANPLDFAATSKAIADAKSIADASAQVASTAASGLPAIGKRSADVFRLLAVCRCTNDEGVLRPADLGPKFASLFPEDAFVADNVRVDYVVTGMKDFDEVFREVAKLRGSVLLVQVWLNEVTATLSAFSSGPMPTGVDDMGKLVASIDRTKVKAAANLPAQLN